MYDLAYLISQMKAPRIAQAVPRVTEQARNGRWSYEDFLTVLLDQEVLARQAHGGEARIRAAHFPARKTVEEFAAKRPLRTSPTRRVCASKSCSTWPPCPSSRPATT